MSSSFFFNNIKHTFFLFFFNIITIASEEEETKEEDMSQQTSQGPSVSVLAALTSLSGVVTSNANQHQQKDIASLTPFAQLAELARLTGASSLSSQKTNREEEKQNEELDSTVESYEPFKVCFTSLSSYERETKALKSLDLVSLRQSSTPLLFLPPLLLSDKNQQIMKLPEEHREISQTYKGIMDRKNAFERKLKEEMDSFLDQLETSERQFHSKQAPLNVLK